VIPTAKAYTVRYEAVNDAAEGVSQEHRKVEQREATIWAAMQTQQCV
jgi:hypothetical protein